jgi:hypothetical protein
MDSIATGIGASKRALSTRVAAELRALLTATPAVSIKFSAAQRAISETMKEVREMRASGIRGTHRAVLQQIDPAILLEVLRTVQEEGLVALTGDPRAPVVRKLG